MTTQAQELTREFSGALRRSAAAEKLRTLRTKVAGNPESRKNLQDMELRMPLNNLMALQQLRGDYSHDLLICEYLDARMELILLLQQINNIVSSQIGINIAASLRPASCCG